MRRKKTGGGLNLTLKPSVEPEPTVVTDEAAHQAHTMRLADIMLKMEARKGEFTKLMTKSVQELSE